MDDVMKVYGCGFEEWPLDEPALYLADDADEALALFREDCRRGKHDDWAVDIFAQLVRLYRTDEEGVEHDVEWTPDMDVDLGVSGVYWHAPNAPTDCLNPHQGDET